MKKEVKVLLFVSIILTGFIYFSGLSSAQVPVDYQCDDANEIFSISALNNAHGERWHSNNYNIEICFDEIFGYTPTNGNTHNPHFPGTCNIDSTQGGRVLRLSESTNAHAQGIEGTDYSTGVCYNSISGTEGGVLFCRTIPANINLDPGECEVVSLSSETNAHLGVAGEYNSPENYKVVCKVSLGGGNVFNPVDGNNCVPSDLLPECNDGIDNDGDGSTDFPNDPNCVSAQDNDESGCGDGVCEGGETSSSCSLDCNVCDLTSASWSTAGPVVEGTNVNLNLQGSSCSGAQINYEIYERDTLSPDDFITSFTLSYGQSASWQTQYVSDASGNPEYYFVASVVGSSPSESIESSPPDLEVEDNLVDDVPEANIIAPVHRGIYFEGVEVTFDQDAGPGYNSGNHELEWKISTPLGDDEIRTGESFDYTFSEAGQYTVTLILRNIGGSVIDEDQVAVLVTGNDELLAFVNDPFHKEAISEDTDGRVNIDFSAEDSYVVESVGSCPTVTCLAGNCPSSTENAPSGCGSSINVGSPNQGFGNLDFTWTFGDGDTDSGESGTATYGAADRGLTTATIDVDYNSGQLTSQFEREFYAGLCINDGSLIVQTSSSGVGVSTIATTTQGCNSLSSGTCCPSGYVCEESGECVLDNAPQDERVCGAHTDVTACNEDFNAPKYYQNEQGYDEERCNTEVNGVFVDCRCVWGDFPGDAEATDECYYRETTDDETGTNSCSSQTEYIGDCVGGVQSIQTTYSGSGCANEGVVEDTILCGNTQIELPFFDFRNMAIALLIVGVIYFVYISIKSSKKRK